MAKTRRSMAKGLGSVIHRHLSAADERFGLRLGGGLIATLVAAATFALLLLLVGAGWPPLRSLDAAAAGAFRQIDSEHPALVLAAEVTSNVFDPNVFRVVLTVIALIYVVNGERHHAIWLVVTVFGGAGLGIALKEIVGRARPVLPEPVSSAPGLSFPSGHALGASIGCCLLLLITLRFLPRGGRVAAVIAAAVIVGAVALSRVVLGVHFVSDVLAGIALGIRLGRRDDVGLCRLAARDWAAGPEACRSRHRRAAHRPLTCCSSSVQTQSRDGKPNDR